MRKPKRRRICRAVIFMTSSRAAVAKVNEAGGEGPHAEGHLQHERQQENQGARADAEQRAAADAGAEGRDAEDRQVEQRLPHAPEMAQRERAEHDADTRKTTPARRSLPRPRDRLDAVHDAGQRGAGEQETEPIERPPRLLLRLSKKIVTSTMPSMPIGTLTRKIQRQEK